MKFKKIPLRNECDVGAVHLQMRKICDNCLLSADVNSHTSHFVVRQFQEIVRAIRVRTELPSWRDVWCRRESHERSPATFKYGHIDARPERADSRAVSPAGPPPAMTHRVEICSIGPFYNAKGTALAAPVGAEPCNATASGEAQNARTPTRIGFSTPVAVAQCRKSLVK